MNYMNKVLRFFITSMAALAVAGGETLYASKLHQEDGILPNHSAEYVRTLSRNASMDADAAFYNPAGLALMKKEGLFLMFSSQTYYAKRLHDMNYWGIANNKTTPAFLIQPTTFLGNPAFKTNADYTPPAGYSAETIAPVFPDLDLIYKGKNWAVYFDLSVTQAAPGMTFERGIADIDFGVLAMVETAERAAPSGLPFGSFDYYLRENMAKRTEYFISGTVGGSYAFLDWLSAALGFRYIYITGNQNLYSRPYEIMTSALGSLLTSTIPWRIDVDYHGNGYGIIAGIDFKPVKDLNIGLRYEYYPPIKVRKKTNKFMIPPLIAASGMLNIFTDDPTVLLINDRINWGGGVPNNVLDFSLMNPKYIKDIGNTLTIHYPQMLSMGLSYNILPNLRVETSADLSLRLAFNRSGSEKKWKDLGYRLGQCIEWTIIPMIVTSVGYSYNDFGIKPDQRTEVDPLLTSHTVGGGLTIKATEYLDITIGALYMFIVPEKVDNMTLLMREGFTGTETYAHFIKKSFDEARWSVALGITAHAFGDGSLFGKVLKGKKEN